MIRIGRISKINYEKGSAEVTYPDRDDMVTQEIPFISYEYNMPDVDDLVLVTHISGAIEDGVIIGKFFNDDNLPIKRSENVYCKEIDKDNCYITYDKTTQEFEIHIKENGTYKTTSIKDILELKEEVIRLREREEELENDIAEHEKRISDIENVIATLGGGS